jgi:predicted TIM-barrel fold metal-dependent hydrolase
MSADDGERPHVIDAHSHYLPATLVAALEGRTTLPRVSNGPNGKVIEYGEGNVHPVLPAMGDLGLRMDDMDAQGIDVAVLGANVPGIDWFPAEDAPSIARDVNDELIEVAATHPRRLAALATLPLQTPEAAAAELQRAAAAGAVGAMIYSNVAGAPLDEPRFEVVFATAAGLGVPLYVHPTYPLAAKTLDAYALIPTLGFLVDTTTAVLRLTLGGLYERHPDLKLVLSHSGSLLPQLVGRIDYEAARAPGGTGKLTVPPSEALALLYTDSVCVWPSALRSTLDFLGGDRIMFGTDYPFWDPRLSAEALDGAGFPDDVLHAIQSDNARRVFGLVHDAAAASPEPQRENPPR